MYRVTPEGFSVPEVPSMSPTLKRRNAEYLLEVDRALGGAMMPDMAERLNRGEFHPLDFAAYSNVVDCCIKAANHVLKGRADSRARYVHSLVPNTCPDYVCAKLHLFGAWPPTPNQERKFQEKIEGGFDPVGFVHKNIKLSKARYTRDRLKSEDKVVKTAISDATEEPPKIPILVSNSPPNYESCKKRRLDV